MNLWTKICGLTRPDDAYAAFECGARAYGLVFAPSKRQVTIEQADKIMGVVPRCFHSVGVFVNAPLEQVRETAVHLDLHMIQLHGDEDSHYLYALRGILPQRMNILKAVHATGDLPSQVESILGDKNLVDALLIDSHCAGRRGGAGATFDWQKHGALIRELSSQMRVILSGGLTPENVARGIELMRPWGVDVSSGVESAPGAKDRDKMRQFLSTARKTSRHLNRTPQLPAKGN